MQLSSAVYSLWIDTVSILLYSACMETATKGKDPEGHYLITRLNALVLLRKLDEAEVNQVIETKDWKRARRLIRAVSWPVGTAR